MGVSSASVEECKKEVTVIGGVRFGQVTLIQFFDALPFPKIGTMSV
jgi:hypothetical protein